VSGAQTAEAPALHRARKPLALSHASDIDQLTRNEVISADMRPNIEQCIFGHAEFDDLRLRLDFGLAESHALRLGNILGLRLASAKLDGAIAVTVLLAAADDLYIVQLQDGDRHVPTVRLEQAGHSDLLRDHAGAHDQTPPQRHRGTIPGACSPTNYCVPRLG
jgi:hypothetical protein